MNKNLKVKVIRSEEYTDFEKQINDFGVTNVNIVATQTSTVMTSNEPYKLVYTAVIYYNDVGLPKL